MPRKLGPWILVAAFAAFFLALFLVFKVLDTEFFRGDPEQGGSASPVENEKTVLADTYCAEAAAKQLGEGAGPRVPGYTAWDIGFNRYLVKAAFERPGQPGREKTYICKIESDGGMGPKGWTVQSIEYLD